MNDIKVEGFDMWEDKLYIMNPATCGKLVELVWLDDETAQMLDESWTEGWYDVDPDYHPYEGKLDFGTGFRSDFSSSSIKFTYTGQVADHAATIGNKREKTSDQYMIIPNVCPREVYFSEITCTGFDMWEDKLYIMNPATCGKLVELVWLDDETAQMLDESWTEGWYDVDPDYHPYAGSLKAGEGVRSDFSSPDVKITFPNPMAATK